MWPESLRDVLELTAACPRLHAFLEAVLQRLLEENDSDVGACLLLLPDARDADPDMRIAGIDRRSARSNGTLEGWAGETRRMLGTEFLGPRRLDHLSRQPEIPRLASRSRSALVVPLLEGRRPLGLLQVESHRPAYYSPRRQAQLESLAELIVLAVPRLLFRERTAEGSHDASFIGVSSAFLDLESQLKQAARCHAPVLLVGERGTGKEVAARAIHSWSRRYDKPFLPVLMSSLPETLAADELFGHEKHAFTGATHTRRGKFEAAQAGTLFLDEVADIDPQLQSILLRVIERNEFSRLGRDLPVQVDSRVIAATNRDLRTACRRGAFRRDLYDRLAVFEIEVPPLRRRRRDIPLLAEHFLRRYCAELHRPRDLSHFGHCRRCTPPGPVACANPAFFQALQAHDWPGNVRELKNLLLRLVVSAPEETFDVHHLPADWRHGAANPETGDGGSGPGKWNLEQAIRDHIETVLELTEYNKSQAARLLEIPYTTLQSKIKRLGIQPPKPAPMTGGCPTHFQLS